MAVLVEDGDWGEWGGLERIDIDIDNLDNPQEIATTHQFDERWWEYVVTSEINQINEKLWECHIHYSPQDNQHIIDECGEDAITWGTHILRLEKGEISGESIWNGRAGPGWRQETIIGKRRRIATTKLQRAQARFRKMLLVQDSCCAVTGENCQEVLDAAHIVPVSNGGQEILFNGILLRADLHRLYDAWKFDICPDTGSIIVHQAYHSFDFGNTEIPRTVLCRTREALLSREQFAPSRDGTSRSR